MKSLLDFASQSSPILVQVKKVGYVQEDHQLAPPFPSWVLTTQMVLVKLTGSQNKQEDINVGKELIRRRDH